MEVGSARDWSWVRKHMAARRRQQPLPRELRVQAPDGQGGRQGTSEASGLQECMVPTKPVGIEDSTESG